MDAKSRVTTLVASLTAAAAFTLLSGVAADARPTPPGIVFESPAATYTAMKRSGRKAMRRSSRGGLPGASGGPSTATRGAPAGSSGGNAVTGTGAAPSGQ